MDLTINGRFMAQQMTGVQRYAREIVTALDHLLAQDAPEEFWRGQVLGQRAAKTDLRLHALRLQATPAMWQHLPGAIWTQAVLPQYARGTLLNLCNTGPLYYRGPQILTIHDANTYLVPDSYGKGCRRFFQTVQPWMAQRATRVVTVSHFSAVMVDTFNVCPRDKITVIPNGHEHVYRWQPERSMFSRGQGSDFAKVEGGFGRFDQRPYVFLLGSQPRHKNVGILFQIAGELDKLGIDLLVAGVTDERYFQTVAPVKAPNVRLLGYVTDDDLAALYKSALCFVFPSLTEGFGLPPLEAMALSCPVITSNCASLPEVCGDAAFYADPKQPRTWLEQIKRLRQQPELAFNLSAAGPVQAAKFSWLKSARLYLNEVREITKKISA
jgi:glycosyltransferase involved in cell wall biosynthesis